MSLHDNVKQVNLMNFDRQGLQSYFLQQGETRFRAEQVMKWIYHHQATDTNQMTDLSKSLRAKLEINTVIKMPQVVSIHVAKDGTIKWLMRLFDDNCVETVFIPERGRGTLCVSSQVGCALNCRFCATGAQGFNRNLSTAEIIGQVWQAQQRLTQDAVTPDAKLTNVVMMGMGEPLLNFDNVLPALNIMLDDWGFGLSKYRVTVSTAGMVPMMDKLSQVSEVSLAVSLHAPNDEVRNQIVPLNKKYPLKVLLDACRRFFPKGSKRQIVMEYVMLAGVNDQPQHAKQLIKILRNIPAKINLIPFNPFPGTEYKCSSQKAIDHFQQMLFDAKMNTVVRKTRGDDIAAACGQLAGDFADRTKRRQRWQQQHATDKTAGQAA